MQKNIYEIEWIVIFCDGVHMCSCVTLFNSLQYKLKWNNVCAGEQMPEKTTPTTNRTLCSKLPTVYRRDKERKRKIIENDPWPTSLLSVLNFVSLSHSLLIQNLKNNNHSTHPKHTWMCDGFNQLRKIQRPLIILLIQLLQRRRRRWWPVKLQYDLCIYLYNTHVRNCFSLILSAVAVVDCCSCGAFFRSELVQWYSFFPSDKVIK